jgi:predicted CopG family antitoxin
MRVSKDLLEKLKAKKLVARESYSDVVARMISKETNFDERKVKNYLKRKKRGKYANSTDIELMQGY